MSDRSIPTHPDQDREFELVLGNKQLFSILFLVFVMLGVFFAMGFVMGRNYGLPETAARQSSGPAGARDERRTAAQGRPSTVEGGTPAKPVFGEETPKETAAEPSRAASPGVSTAAPPAAETKAAGAPAAVIDPKPGQTFLQVSAVARPEAELLVEVLDRKGFPAALAPGPTDKIFRVLVGPAPSEADLAKLKGELEQSGFKPMLRRY